MRIIEIILTVFISIGLLFKALLYPGGSAILVFSLGSLSMLYTYFGFLLLNGIQLRHMFKKASYKEYSTPRIIGSILLGVSIGTLIIGLLFKIQFYPGAFIMMTTGFFSTSLILAVFIIKSLTSTPSDIFQKNKVRLVLIMAFGLFFTVISTNNIIDFRFRNDPEFRNLFKQSLADPNNQELKEQLELMRIKRERGYSEKDE